MAKFSEQMQQIFSRYTAEVGPAPVSLEDVAGWAVSKGLYRPAPRDVVRMCKEDLAESLRQEKRVDAKGRKYRAKHCVRVSEAGVQYSLWSDIDLAPHSFMEKSVAQRRKQIVGDCYQIKIDVDHYNDERGGNSPINMVLDFTDDVAEMKASLNKGNNLNGEAA